MVAPTSHLLQLLRVQLYEAFRFISGSLVGKAQCSKDSLPPRQHFTLGKGKVMVITTVHVGNVL